MTMQENEYFKSFKTNSTYVFSNWALLAIAISGTSGKCSFFTNQKGGDCASTKERPEFNRSLNCSLHLEIKGKNSWFCFRMDILNVPETMRERIMIQRAYQFDSQ